MGSEPLADEARSSPAATDSSTARRTEPSLAGFYPPEVVELLESRQLQALGLYPLIVSRRLLAAHSAEMHHLPLPYPLPGIAKIRCTKHDGHDIEGSAFIIWITPTLQTLLTAAHNLLPLDDPLPGNRVPVTNIRVSLPGIPGQPGVQNGLLPVNVSGSVCSGKWSTNPTGNPDRDYGIIFITGALPYNNKISPKLINNPSALHTMSQATLSGYRQAQDALTTGHGPFSVTPMGNLIGYQLDSYPGQSGGPVYIPQNGLSVAVAVHAYLPLLGVSRGPVVDGYMRQELINWIGSDPCV